MNCPACGTAQSSVYKTQDDGKNIARQRNCKCGARWFTDERVRKGTLMVISQSLVTPNQPPVTSEDKYISGNLKVLSGSDQASSKPSDAPAMEPPVFTGLVCSEIGVTWDVPAILDRALAKAHPLIDRQEQYAKAAAWLLANQAKRKTPRGMARFLVNWFSNAQNSNRAPSAPVRQLDPRCLHHAKGWTSRPKELQAGCPNCDGIREREAKARVAAATLDDSLKPKPVDPRSLPTKEQLQALRRSVG